MKMALFGTVSYPVKIIPIACDRLCSLVLFIYLLAAKFLVSNRVDVCWCPISVKNRYSPVWKFVSFAPISYYIADASTFLIILHYKHNAMFGSGIYCGGFPIFFSLGIR